MKTILYCGGLLLWMAAGPLAHAEDSGQNTDGNAKLQRTDQLQERMTAMKARLKLTPEQIEQMRPIVMEELKKVQDVASKYQASDQRPRTKLKMARQKKEIRTDADAKLKPILSPEQMAELENMRQERREEFRQRRN